MEELIIETVPYSSDNYCYLIHHPPSKMTALVDCGDAEAVARHLEEFAAEKCKVRGQGTH